MEILIKSLQVLSITDGHVSLFYRNFANKYKIVCFFITFITLQIDKVVFSPSKKSNFLLVLDKKKVYSS